MPTILRRNGIEVMIYTADHRPKHVHCFIGGEETIINLETLVIRWSDAKRVNQRRALALVTSERDFLIAEWDRIGPVA